MKLQVLISTMHQKDHQLLERMNIQSDAIVVNQCDHDEIERFDFRGHEVLWMSLKERGVGLSRNTAFMRASADIVLFADDDVVYEDGYADKVIACFEKYPSMDMIMFNLQSMNPRRPEALIQNDHRLHLLNCLKFGAFRIGIRRETLLKANVCFSLLFGGGAIYQSGEDSLFIVQCLKKGIRGMASNINIGTVKQTDSTWFKGFDERYFYDKGVLMKHCFGHLAEPLLVALIVKNSTQFQQIGLKDALKSAFAGLRGIQE